MSAVTNDIARMQDLLKEAKRLTDIAGEQVSQVGGALCGSSFDRLLL